MFFLWTLAVYTAGFVILETIAIVLLEAIFAGFGLLPPDTSSITLPIFFCLIIIYFLGTLSALSQAITRIKTQSKSFLVNNAPFLNKKGVRKMQSKVSWVKFYLPIEALLRFGIPGAILVALISFGIGTLFSGLWAHAIGYGLSGIIFYQVLIALMGGADVLGGILNQFEKDAQSISRNYVLAKAEEEKISLQRRALQQSQSEHQQRLTDKHFRDQAHQRDRARRRKDGRISMLRNVVNFFK